LEDAFASRPQLILELLFLRSPPRFASDHADDPSGHERKKPEGYQEAQRERHRATRNGSLMVVPCHL
jgi:hypothetical protein